MLKLNSLIFIFCILILGCKTTSATLKDVQHSDISAIEVSLVPETHEFIFSGAAKDDFKSLKCSLHLSVRNVLYRDGNNADGMPIYKKHYSGFSLSPNNKANCNKEPKVWLIEGLELARFKALTDDHARLSVEYTHPGNNPEGQIELFARNLRMKKILNNDITKETYTIERSVAGNSLWPSLKAAGKGVLQFKLIRDPNANIVDPAEGFYGDAAELVWGSDIFDFTEVGGFKQATVHVNSGLIDSSRSVWGGFALNLLDANGEKILRLPVIASSKNGVTAYHEASGNFGKPHDYRLELSKTSNPNTLSYKLYLKGSLLSKGEMKKKK